MIGENKSKQTGSQKCGSGIGRGWYEDEDPRLGKARRHSEAAQKEKLRDTLTAPMKKSSDEDVPILPEISTEQLEKDEIIKLDFTAHIPYPF